MSMTGVFCHYCGHEFAVNEKVCSEGQPDISLCEKCRDSRLKMIEPGMSCKKCGCLESPFYVREVAGTVDIPEANQRLCEKCLCQEVSSWEARCIINTAKAKLKQTIRDNLQKAKVELQSSEICKNCRWFKLRPKEENFADGAGQCFLEPQTEPKMDSDFCSHFERRADPVVSTPETGGEKGWMETAKFHAINEEFYRGIVRQIGEMFGDAAKTSDDGTIQDSVLALKVPELVAGALYGHLRLTPDQCDKLLAAGNEAARLEFNEVFSTWLAQRISSRHPPENSEIAYVAWRLAHDGKYRQLEKDTQAVQSRGM